MNADKANPPPPARHVLVTGATGLIGRALVRSLLQSGATVVVLTRDIPRAARRLGAGVLCVDRLDALPDDADLDAVVHLAGSRVLDRRWSDARRQALIDSRVMVAAEVVNLVRRLRRPPRVLVSASAVSVYGASGSAPRTEADTPVDGGFASELCVRIEAAASLAREVGVRVVPLRLGIVLARDDGALPPLAASARFGVGAVLGSGRQPVPWIHLQDAVRLIRFAIDAADVSGPLNAVAPEVPSQSDFIRAVAARFARHVRLRVPALALRALLGERAVLLLDGQVAVPRAALEAGFTFSFPTLAGALQDLLPG